MKRLLVLLAALLLLDGCGPRLPAVDRMVLKPKTSDELQEYLVEHEPEVLLFRTRGPFAVTTVANHEFRLSAKERYSGDLYLSAAQDKAPLVIFVHGHEATKGDHSAQAAHMASWGMHALCVQLPNKGPWIANGRAVARIAAAIARSPGLVDQRVDPKEIILVGHSFGATAVSVALAEKAPVLGGILLDPAAIGRELPQILRQVTRPVMVIGADDEVFTTRNRDYFYEYIRGNVAEVSIRGAAHEDAQYPLRKVADAGQTEEAQIAFTSAITSSAMSLAATGGFDYAWASFGPVLDTGKFFNARRK